MTPLPRRRDCGNLLLDRLPDEEYAALRPELQAVRLGLKQVIQEFDSAIDLVYFPTTGLASLLTVMEDERPVEAATVGREGIVGAAASLGIEASQQRVICQMQGEALALPADRFLDSLGPGSALDRLVRLHLAYSLRDAGQMLACNALHAVESRACKWLLRLHDQAAGDEFLMTQELLAYMLGARRQTVTLVAGGLASAGLITYRRGALTVVDRVAMEDASCECYGVMKAYYARMFA